MGSLDDSLAAALGGSSLDDSLGAALASAPDDPEWETLGAVQRNRKTGQIRPTPQFQGAAPGLGKLEDPYTNDFTPGFGQLAARVKEGIFTLPETAASVVGWFANKMAATPHPIYPGPGRNVYGDGLARDVRDSVAEEYARKKDEVAQSMEARGAGPILSASADTGLEGIAQVVDPTNYLLAAKSLKAARVPAVADDAIEAGAKVLGKEADDPLAKVFAELADEMAAEQRGTLGAAATRARDAQILAARPNPEAVLADKLDEAGRSVAELERMAGKGPKITATEAAASPDLGITALEDGERLYVVKGKDGRDVGSLVAQPAGDGFKVRHVFVDEAARGKGVPEDLYRAAHRDLGPYLGSTDYAGRRTSAGEALAERLKTTAPEIFEPAPSDPGFARLVVGDDLKAAQAEQRRLARLRDQGQELAALDSPEGFGRLAEGPELQKKIADYQARLPGALVGDDTLFTLDPNAPTPRLRPPLAENAAGVIPGVRRRGGAIPYAGKPTLKAETSRTFQYNVDRLDVADELKPELDRVLRSELADKLPGAGGGTIPGLQGKLADPKVIDSLALKLGMTPEELAKKRPGFVLDTSGAAVLDAGLTSTTNKLKALADDIATGKISPADLPAALERQAELSYKRDTLLLASSGTASEQGRALGARRFKIPGLSAEQARKVAIQRRYQMTPKQLDALAKLDASRPEDVNTFLRGVDKANVGNMVTSLWRASIMSGIPTQLRNILGNTTQLAWEMGVRPLTAGIEQGGLAKLHGRAPLARIQDTVPAFIGAYDGAKAGFGKAWAVLKTGMTPETAGKIDLPRMNSFELVQNPVLRGLGKAATEPVYRTLGAVDTFFRYVGWTSKQYESAARLATQEGKPLAEMMADPRVLKEAEDFAKRITYTDEPSKIAKSFSGLAKGFDEVTHTPIGTFMIPFTSVPDRILARSFEATPAGLMRGAWQAAKKDPKAAESLAKGALGTAIAWWGYERAKEGLMTAGVPTDPAERAQFYALGAQPYSVKLGDRWVPYNQLGPAGFSLAMAAQIAEYQSQTGDDEGVVDKLLSAGLGAANYVMDQSYVDSYQKITEVISSRDDIEPRREKLRRWLNQSVAGLVPYSALQRNIAQAADPRVTDPKGLVQTWEANTPGLSRNVPGKLTPWGQEITRQESPPGAFLPRNTPLYALAQKETPVDPVEAEMARLGIAAPFVGKSLDATVRRPKRPLSEEEWRSYQTDAGQAAHARIEQLISLPGWQLLNDDVKRKRLKQILELERKRSRIKLFGT